MTDSTATVEATPEQRKAAVNALIAKCWNDETFKQALIADPVGVMKAEGLAVQNGMSIKAHAASANHFVLVIPQKSTNLSDAELDAIAGGGLMQDFEDIFKIVVKRVQSLM